VRDGVPLESYTGEVSDERSPKIRTLVTPEARFKYMGGALTVPDDARLLLTGPEATSV
jgi:hypothetical protein